LRALLAAPDPLVWVTAGDSIAQGARWTDGQRDYAQLLEERVRYELARTADVFARTAVSGWRISDVYSAIGQLDRLAPDIVSIGVGVNDATLGADGLGEFCRTYQAVLDRLHARGVLVILQLPNTVQPSAEHTLRRSIPDYAESMREMGHRSGALVVDHFRTWSNAGKPATENWMADHLHPNGRGHLVLARTLFQACGLWDQTSACCQLIASEPFPPPPVRT